VRFGQKYPALAKAMTGKVVKYCGKNTKNAFNKASAVKRAAKMQTFFRLSC
jgi:hypothetical protein